MNIDQAFLNHQRQQTDPDADALVIRIFCERRQADLYALFQMNHAKVMASTRDPSLRSFLLAYRSAPSWYNEKKITAGQQVFRKYAQEIMVLLGALALPYCYVASPGNKALYFSEKMRNSPGKRLMETAQFIIDVLTPGNLQDGKEGYLQISKTRLIHATARYHIMTKGGWDDAWGAPVNQEDMSGTNLAFSSIILKGLISSGFVLSDEEKESYLYVWRYIGYQLHIHEDLLASSFKEALLLEHAIKQRHFRSSAEGTALTRSLIEYYQRTIEGPQAGLIEAQIGYFLGKSDAALLGIAEHPVKDTIVRSLNAARRAVNFFHVNPNSFTDMLSNQEVLKKKIYSGKVI